MCNHIIEKYKRKKGVSIQKNNVFYADCNNRDIIRIMKIGDVRHQKWGNCDFEFNLPPNTNTAKNYFDIF